MGNLRYLLTIILVIVISTSTFCQIKFEKISRIDHEVVPLKASRFIDNCGFDKKIKWYKEESQDGISLEAKTKYNKHRFSIEFDTLGQVQDVEKTVRFNRLERTTRNAISRGLEKSFEKHRIIKIQVQWKAENSILQQLIKTGDSDRFFEVRYEIIVKGEREGAKHLYEVLLSKDGTPEKVSKIVQRATDNMEF